MATEGKTEIRAEVPSDELAVIDAHCQATGKSRTDIVRTLIREFSECEIHRATMVLRAVRINPLASEPNRNGSGN